MRAVACDGFDDGVAADDFAVGVGSGVAVVGRLDVRGENGTQLWQPLDELRDDVLNPFLRLLLVVVLLCAVEAESGLHLFGEEVTESFQADADVVG